MAEPEHVAVLKRGVPAWNEWRLRNPERTPDLRGADLVGLRLSGAQLSDSVLVGADMRGSLLTGAYLYQSNLRGAQLSQSNLSGAHLTRSVLAEADLSASILCGADLGGAILMGSDLRWADLSGADLSEAMIVGADLKGANVSGAMIGLTSFSNVDLSDVEGIESVTHWGPSSIGIDTIYKSQGKLPKRFLSNCGVPDALIVEMKALVSAIEPIQFYSCLIGSTRSDQEFAERLLKDLQTKGFRCWNAVFEPSNKEGGFLRWFDEAIRIYDRLVLPLSAAAVDDNWLDSEIEKALQKERRTKKLVIFPLVLDDAVAGVNKGWAADLRRTRRLEDFRNWKDNSAYQRSLDGLLERFKGGRT